MPSENDFFHQISDVRLSTSQIKLFKRSLDDILLQDNEINTTNTKATSTVYQHKGSLKSQNILNVLKNDRSNIPNHVGKTIASTFSSFPWDLEEFIDDYNSFDIDDPHTTGDIDYVIERLKNNKYLVRILPPCDLSAFSLKDQPKVLKVIVEQALDQQNLSDSGNPINFNDVYVSAFTGVKGQLQHMQNNLGKFNYTNTPASHFNGFIKTPGEKQLTRLEPRNGPQATLDDGICAMVTTLCLAQFEDGVKKDLPWSRESKHIVQSTLKHPEMINLFQNIQVTNASKKSKVLGAIVYLMLTFAKLWNTLKWQAHQLLSPKFNNMDDNLKTYVKTGLDTVISIKQNNKDVFDTEDIRCQSVKSWRSSD